MAGSALGWREVPYLDAAATPLRDWPRHLARLDGETPGGRRVFIVPGCRWRDVPAAYGPPTTIYNRYNRWAGHGIWQRLFEKIAASGPVPDELSIDSTHVKAHRSAAGSKRGSGTKRSAARAVAGPARYIAWPTIAADRSPSR